MRGNLICGVFTLVHLSRHNIREGHRWPSPFPLPLGFSGISQGPALMPMAVWHLVHCSVSIWLSVLRLPAHQLAAPKCHTPLPCGLPVFQRSAHLFRCSNNLSALGKLVRTKTGGWHYAKAGISPTNSARLRWLYPLPLRAPA